MISFSPNHGSTSPDLIFEMSPISSDISPSHPFASDVTALTKNAKAQDPFLYPFPKFSLQNGSGHRRQTRSFHPTRLASQRRFPFTIRTNHRHDDLSAPAAGAVVGTLASASSFAPLTPISPKRRSPITALKSICPSVPLHPSLPNASRSIVRNENDIWDEENASAELDVAPLDFQKYLMRRIENQTGVYTTKGPSSSLVRNPIDHRGRSLMSTVQR